LSSYDGKWIYISSDYLKSLGGSLLSTNKAGDKQITSADIGAAARAVTSVTTDYLFTTKPDKAVFVKKAYLGKEKVDGINAYHYRVGINTTNAKAYCVALSNSMLSTSAYQKLSGNDAAAIAESKKTSVQDCKDEVDQNIKSSDTFDMWIDGHYKLIHKIRIYDETDKTNYFDIGQNYKGGNALSLFMKYHSGTDKTDTSATLDTNLDTNTTSGTLISTSTQSDDPYTIKVTLNAKSLTTPVKITKPTGATSIQEILSKLGLPTTYTNNLVVDDGSDSASATQASSTSVEAKARNSKRQTDIQNVQSQLEAYFQNAGNYPSLADMNSTTWLKTNMKSLDSAALKDPQGSSTTLSSKPAAKVYSYAPLNEADASCESDDTSCVSYTLTATLEGDAGTYVKKNLD
jgi:hypothetical protein